MMYIILNSVQKCNWVLLLCTYNTVLDSEICQRYIYAYESETQLVNITGEGKFFKVSFFILDWRSMVVWLWIYMSESQKLWC